jgi:hypothetical protein
MLLKKNKENRERERIFNHKQGQITPPSFRIGLPRKDFYQPRNYTMVCTF